MTSEGTPLRFLNTHRNAVLSFSLSYILSYQAFTLFLNYLTNYLFFGDNGWIGDTLAIYLVLLLCFLIIVIYMVFDRKRIVLGFFAFLVLSYSITYLIFPANRSFMWTSLTDIRGNPVYFMFVFNFLCFAAVKSIDDFQIFEKIMERFSYLVILMSVSHFIVPSDKRTIYMTFSYNILLQTVVLALLFIRDGGVGRLLFALFGALMILVGGGRGPLLIAFLVPIGFFLHKGKASRRLKALTVLVLVLIGSLITLTPLLNWFSELLGLESRSIEKIVSGSFFKSSDRIGIYKSMIERIGILGKGLFADRLITSYGYAHNIVFELLVQYGLVAGSCIFVFLILVAIKGMKSPDVSVNLMCYALLSTGLLKLIVSGSYLNEEPALYALLALAITQRHDTCHDVSSI